MEQTIEVIVEGGKASAAPPLGPALGPLGVDIQGVVDSINKKTGDLAGMKVPVKVIIDTDSKEYKIEVGKPPASALILKELGIEKGSALPGTDRVGDLSIEQVKKIARAKFGSDDESYINQIKGACRSLGVTIDEGRVTAEEVKAAQEHKEHVKEEEKKEASAEGEEGEGSEEKPEGEEEEKKEDENKEKTE